MTTTFCGLLQQFAKSPKRGIDLGRRVKNFFLGIVAFFIGKPFALLKSFLSSAPNQSENLGRSQASPHAPAAVLGGNTRSPGKSVSADKSPIVSLPSQTGLPDTLSVHLARLDPLTERNDQTPSTTIILRHSEVFRHDEEHIFEELILHKDYERLWRSLIHAGGVRNLLTGYGPFGGTSLVKCAIAKARTELQRGGQDEGALLVFYFRVTQEAVDHFEVEATDLGFSLIKKNSEYNDNTDMAELEARAGANKDTTAQVLNFSLNKPLETTFFASASESTSKSEALGRDYDLSQFVADLNTFFKQRKTNRALKNIVMRLAGSQSLRSRVVLIIDKVQYLETLEILSRSELFSNRRTRVIAVARKEQVDIWDDVDVRLRGIGFSKWYIPCLWNIDFDNSLFSKATDWKIELESEYKLFLKHLEYIGRGSLGNVIAELKQPSNTNYGSGRSFVDVGAVVDRPSVQHNAWVQDVLYLNWDSVLGDLFGGPDQDERTDRARIGVYHLLDWIIEIRRFTREEVVEAAQNSSITISDDTEEIIVVVNNLLHVLSKNRYLSLRDGTYRMVWNKDRPPKYRKVRQSRQKVISRQRVENTARSVDESDPPNEARLDTPISDCTDRLNDQANAVPQESQPTIISSVDLPTTDHLSQLDEVAEQQEPGVKPASRSPATVDLPEKTVIRQKDIGQPGKKILKTVTETVTKKTQVIIEGETAMSSKVNILIVFANPKNSDPLRLGEEDRTIRECIKRSNNRDSLNYKIIHAARIKDVQRELLEDEFQIVHFSGHGAPSGQLALEDENGDIKLVPQHALAGLLSKFQSIECVILNACYSVGQGKVIALGVPLVIAMDGPISDDAAKHFTRGFYDTIGAGKDCRFAYKMGCDAISLEDYPEQSTPKCFEK